jgi:hypothetical protein
MMCVCVHALLRLNRFQHIAVLLLSLGLFVISFFFTFSFVNFIFFIFTFPDHFANGYRAMFAKCTGGARAWPGASLHAVDVLRSRCPRVPQSTTTRVHFP